MASRALYTAATSMSTRQTETEIISNNIANINTTAFKKQRAETADLFYQYYKRPGANDSNTVIPSGIYVGAGVAVQGVSRLLTEGPLQETQNDLHLAIIGKGYFKVILPDGTYAYTRAGNFQLDENGQIVTHQDYVVSPAITLPNDTMNVIIDPNGTVSVILPQTIDPQEIGVLDMVTFINEGGLEAIGDNLYIETIASGDPITGNATQDGFGYIKQRWLEGSNVDITIELTNLITTQRAFEIASKVIQAVDDMLQTLNQAKK